MAQTFWTELVENNFDIERWLCNCRNSIIDEDERREREVHEWRYFQLDQIFDEEIERTVLFGVRCKISKRRITKLCRKYLKRKKAALKIQRLFFVKRYYKRIRAAKKIQKFFRTIFLRQLGKTLTIFRS